MENAYLTIKEAIAHIGRSEETIRRWVRSTRAQFLVELSDTNQELEQKAPLLRKQNESQPDGAIRRDRNGLPVFDWLLQRVALEESFREEGAPLTLPQPTILSYLLRVPTTIPNHPVRIPTTVLRRNTSEYTAKFTET